MTCSSFRESVVWNSIKHINFSIPLPLASEDCPALSRALYRRHQKLTSVESFVLDAYPDPEVTHLLLKSVSSTLKTIVLKGHFLPDMWDAFRAALKPKNIENLVVYTEFPLDGNRIYPKLTRLDACLEFSQISKVAAVCPALQFLTVQRPPSTKSLGSTFSQEWMRALSALQALPSFLTLSLNGTDYQIPDLLNNPENNTFNGSVINFIETKLGVNTLPLIRVGWDQKSIAEWMITREIHEPSNDEYWTLYKWCHSHETHEKQLQRFVSILSSQIVPKRRALARKSLGIFLDRFASFIISDETKLDVESVVLLVTALDLSMLHDRAKFWFDKLGRSAYLSAKQSRQSLRNLCVGENIAWAGFIAQALKDEAWCRSSGFLDDMVDILKNSSVIRQNFYNIRPGIFALMLNYPELERVFADSLGVKYSNAHSGYIGRMLAEYDVATDIPPLSANIGKLVKLMRIMRDAGNDYSFRLTELTTEEHKWKLGLLSYWPNETPEFQEARLILMTLCSTALNYLSTENACTWLDAPDDVSLSQLADLVTENSKAHSGNYREKERFTSAVWVAVFDLVSKGRDPVRIVKRALQFSQPPTSISDPATFNMSSINLESLQRLSPGFVPGKFSVYTESVVADVQKGLHANL